MSIYDETVITDVMKKSITSKSSGDLRDQIQANVNEALEMCKTEEQLQVLLRIATSMKSMAVAMTSKNENSLTPVSKKRGNIDCQNRYFSTKKRKKLEQSQSTKKRNNLEQYSMTSDEKNEFSAALVLSNL